MESQLKAANLRNEKFLKRCNDSYVVLCLNHMYLVVRLGNFEEDSLGVINNDRIISGLKFHHFETLFVLTIYCCSS